jgi:hypothetical protein
MVVKRNHEIKKAPGGEPRGLESCANCGGYRNRGSVPLITKNDGLTLLIALYSGHQISQNKEPFYENYFGSE